METGLDPTDIGKGHCREIKKAMDLVTKRQGKRGMAVLFNYWNRANISYAKGIDDVGRKFILCTSEDWKEASEERLAELIENRDDVDLVADLSMARGWEDSTVVVVDCNKGKGIENLFMRTVSNLIVVKIPIQGGTEEGTEEEVQPYEIDNDIDIDDLIFSNRLW